MCNQNNLNMQNSTATLKNGDVVFWVSSGGEYVLIGKVSNVVTRTLTEGDNAGRTVKDIDFILEDGTTIRTYGNIVSDYITEIYDTTDSDKLPGWIFLNETDAFYHIKKSIDLDMADRQRINAKIDKKIENLTKVYKVVYGDRDESTENSTND